MFHKALHHKACLGKVFGLLSRVDCHSEALARTVYCASSPEDDAALGKHLFYAVFGTSVQWQQTEEADTDVELTIEEPDVEQVLEEPDVELTIEVASTTAWGLQCSKTETGHQQSHDESCEQAT